MKSSAELRLFISKASPWRSNLEPCPPRTFPCRLDPGPLAFQTPYALPAQSFFAGGSTLHTHAPGDALTLRSPPQDKALSSLPFHSLREHNDQAGSVEACGAEAGVPHCQLRNCSHNTVSPAIRAKALPPNSTTLAVQCPDTN